MSRGKFKNPKERSIKISNSLRGIPKSQEHKNKLSVARRGIHYSSKTEFKKGQVSAFKGYHHTKELKLRMGEQRKMEWRMGLRKAKPMSNSTKIKLSILKKGVLNYKLRGRKLSDEVKTRISNARKGKPNLKTRGKNHWNWKGGITPLKRLIRTCLKYYQWKDGVFKRDNYTCMECNKREVTIFPHHIKPCEYYGK